MKGEPPDAFLRNGLCDGQPVILGDVKASQASVSGLWS